MTSLTFREARNEILTIFNGVWTEEVRWEDVSDETKLPDGAWARPTVRHTLGQQGSLSGGLSTTRWEREGILAIQIFVPRGRGLSEGYDLAKVVADAYEGAQTPGGVWFRDVTVNEIGTDGSFVQVNVTMTFTYDEIK